MADPFNALITQVASGGVSVEKVLAQLGDRMQRGVIRKMVGTAGTMLAKEMRSELKATPMIYSRTVNEASRRYDKSISKKPLVKTIGKRAYSKPKRGLIGTVVGPVYPAGAHSHLVEFGHIMANGQRTVANPFATRAAEDVAPRVLAAMKTKMRDAINKLDMAGKI